MRRTLLRATALVLAIAVVTFFVQASSGRARDPAAPSGMVAATDVAAQPSASAAMPAVDDGERGIMGPSTKADPHAVRRAVQSLAPSSAPAAP
jgi:hypothetical protein